ncbi:MAG: glycosyltransferase family 4 protein [Candidatus Magasanikbacteria bacterium]|jgi:glycosyltransferase involved in cell wall biosynthesis|nr:glycosyltransferase family 4 protein [Candidatus Magasanikbacteria bacterium]MBT5820672.1 glycosyltransferase family 4 protein [Candidatus Magasanikbacteria bacterium]MBT6294415.1 glycosyltransferase family 4 protein [Candidatus Magasanikbacteria bacterium]
MVIGIDIRTLLERKKTGVGEYTYELLSAIFRQNTSHTYILFANRSAAVPIDIPPHKNNTVHVVYTKIPNKLLHFSLLYLTFPKLDKLLVKKLGGLVKQVDYFFSPNIGFCALSKQCTHILTIHDLSFLLYKECLTKKRQLWHHVIRPKKQCEGAGHVITPSRSAKRDVQTVFGISPEKITPIYPGVSRWCLSDVNNNTSVKECYVLPEKYILFLGTIEPRKNITRLIDAYTKAVLHDKGYHLLIAGKLGWKSDAILKKIVDTPGVRYLGYVPEEHKKALYGLATLFVYPSLYEGFGFPVVEAMTREVPVITSNRSSLPEVVGSAAYLVDPYNTNELAEGMVRVLGSEALQDMYREKGKVQVKRYSWDVAAEQFLTLLKQ